MSAGLLLEDNAHFLAGYRPSEAAPRLDFLSCSERGVAQWAFQHHRTGGALHARYFQDWLERNWPRIDCSGCRRSATGAVAGFHH
jgi:hypothetical protein